jgi:hypothetical protein
VARAAVVIVFAAGLAPLAAQEPPKPTLEFTGLALANAYFNTAPVNNVDVPQFALVTPTEASALGGSVRQSRLGLLFTDPDVVAGTFSGELDADFFGDNQTSGGRAFATLRLRRAVGTIAWPHLQLLFGQESPLVSERNPRSLASIGIPEFAAAGNLWLWLPQLRVTAEGGSTLRLAVQAAALAPSVGPPAADTGLTGPDSAERSGRPFFEGRLRLGWGPTDDPSELAIGGHLGWLAQGDSVVASRAVTADTRVKVGRFELIGEAFSGQALAVLGGGGIGQNVGPRGDPVRTQGGWAQVNWKLRPDLLLGAGCGADHPNEADLTTAAGAVGGRVKNVACAGHVDVRPGSLVFGLEVRRLATTYAMGESTATQVNLATGFQF